MRISETRPRCSRSGFTLVELLVVVFIIGVLIAILIPVVGNVRIKARVASTTQRIASIQQAIQQYEQTFNSAPGPLTGNQIMSASGVQMVTVPPAGYDVTWNDNRITEAENLVLGLLGGLYYDAGAIRYNPALVGSGPNSLNPANPKTYTAFMNGTDNLLSWKSGAAKTGRFSDDGGIANDTIIPEFVDDFSDPLPILYLRARKGTPLIADQAYGNYQYFLDQVIGYTNASIGVGRENPTHGLRTLGANAALSGTGPYELRPYLYNSKLSTAAFPVPKQKDGYILISAGKDRVYGTSDDITNFGVVE